MSRLRCTLYHWALFHSVFVVALDLRGIGLGDGEVGVEEIPSVVGGFGGDGVFFAFPLEDVVGIDAVGEIFVCFELPEGVSGLAGDLLGVGLGGCEFGEVGLGFGFGDAQFTALPIVVFAPRAPSAMTWRLPLCSILMRRWASVSSS
jgi:hypothetical protein